MKKFLLPLVIVAAVCACLLAFRFFVGGPEDSWICVDGQWERHGNPQDQPPVSGCGENDDRMPSGRGHADEFSNGQKFQVFRDGNFEVKYPDWPNVSRDKLLEPDRTKVAVANAGCNFVITATRIPADTNFQAFMEGRLGEMQSQSQFPVEVVEKNIGESDGYVIADLRIGQAQLRSVSYGFEADGQSFGIGFLSEKATYDSACKPFVSEVLESVQVN